MDEDVQLVTFFSTKTPVRMRGGTRTDIVPDKVHEGKMWATPEGVYYRPKKPPHTLRMVPWGNVGEVEFQEA